MRRGPSWAALAVACVLLRAGSSAAVDVGGAWNTCLFCDEAGCGSEGLVGPTLLAQDGGQVSGWMLFSSGEGPSLCAVDATLDAASGLFTPGGGTAAPCPVLVEPALAAFGAVSGRWREAVGSGLGAFVALRPCNPGAPQACDDGDPATVDACSPTVSCAGVAAMPPSCVHTGCASAADCDDGNPCTTDACDATIGCLHTIPDPASPPRCQDADACTAGDVCTLAICSSGPPATPITKPRAVLQKLLAPPGDDRFQLVGELRPPTTTTLDPVANGIRLAVLDAAGALVAEIAVPGGAYDADLRVGWRVTASKVTYVDRRRAEQGPISAVVLYDRATVQTPGLVRFKVKGKAGTYPVTAGSLPLGFAIDLDPQPGLNATGCAAFGSPPARPACSISRTGTTVRCK